MKAKLYVNAVVFDKILAPFNTLVNSKRISMTVTDLAGQYGAWFTLAKRLASGEWAFLADADYRAFDVAGLGDWEDAEMEKEQTTADGAGKVKQKAEVRALLYSTVGSEDWEEIHVHAAAHFKAHGEAMCASLRRNCADMLSPDGAFCVEKQTTEMRGVAAECRPENDACEHRFAGARTSRLNRPNQSNVASVQLSVVRSNGQFDLPPKPRVPGRRGGGAEAAPAGGAVFLGLSQEEQAALVSATRGPAGRALAQSTRGAVLREKEARAVALAAIAEEKKQKAIGTYQEQDALLASHTWIGNKRGLERAAEEAAKQSQTAARKVLAGACVCAVCEFLLLCVCVRVNSCFCACEFLLLCVCFV